VQVLRGLQRLGELSEDPGQRRRDGVRARMVS
jgi:hypothetical protein